MLDLDRLRARYQEFAGAFTGVEVHYAVKCNNDQRVLQTLHTAGCNFEVASLPELFALEQVGVDPATVIFTHPVKLPEHIAGAKRLGVWRYAADSDGELEKLAEFAPGASVLIRLHTTPRGSVDSEGKFGVDANNAVRLAKLARQLRLEPYGLAFHVGSQVDKAAAWTEALDHCRKIMLRLLKVGIKLEAVDMGGGFPASYGKVEPPVKYFSKEILADAKRLPYPVQLIAEPGRALVAEAGDMYTTVMGVAERRGTWWAHLDTGAFHGLIEALESANTLAFPISPVGPQRKAKRVYNLTGPSCDSQDTIRFGVELPELQAGDVLRIGHAGAYSVVYSASSAFNGFASPQVFYAPDPALATHS